MLTKGIKRTVEAVEMDVVRRSARMSRLEKVGNKDIKKESCVLRIPLM